MQAFANAYLAITGLLAIALLRFGNARGRAWAPFIGLAGQPAWLYIAIEAHAPGVMVLTLAYTVVWAGACVRTVKTWGDEPAGYRM